MSTTDGAPVLCKRCGAPTEVQRDLTVQCRFCGTPDRLPQDELGRVLEIKGRLAMAAGRAMQLASSEAALASIFERKGAFWSVMGPFPVFAIGVVCYALYGAYATLSSLPDAVPNEVRIDLVVAAAYGPLFILGITISLPLALLVGRMSYRKNVRPQLAARSPRFAGAPMRCRACGGDLPQARDAVVSCTFCRTQNIVSADLARDAAKRLDEELAAYRAQASGIVTGTSRAATHMTRTFVVCFALTYVAIFALGAAARAVLGALAS
ncbi:MAG: hypothetical protein JWP97_3646 [Labilithrix sp.]|nr:hypothetical protein [Labilithrix sp.]